MTAYHVVGLLGPMRCRMSQDHLRTYATDFRVPLGESTAELWNRVPVWTEQPAANEVAAA